MKSPLLLSILTLIVLFGIIACRKNLINEELHPDQKPADANVFAAKKWYNEFFKKSAEWASYNSARNRTSGEANGKKEPDWEHGSYNKLGNLEIMEFPLFRSSTSFSLPAGSLTDEEKIKLAKASLSRIAFIKNDKNEITVREIDYIPEWQYLQKKNFDISNVMYGKTGEDFTGRIFVKNWNEDILSMSLVENGKITKKGSIKNANDTRLLRLAPGDGSGECQPMQVCVWRQTCIGWYSGTVLLYESCGGWYNTGNCWIENYCGGSGGSTGNDCYPTTAPANARIEGSITNESTGTATAAPCPCEFYGTCEKTDCAGVVNGTATWDISCGCIGGTTGRTKCPPPCNTFEFRVKSVLKTEGGFINDPKDPGGATNKGICWNTWQSSAMSILGINPTLQNLENLTEDQAMSIYKNLYWDKVNADNITDGDIRYLIFDFYVNAGGNSVKVLQRTLNQLGSNVSVDGAMGAQTLSAINSANKIDLYNTYKANRQAYYNNIVANNPSQSKWINGWTNRVNSFINKSESFFSDVNCV
ncbi:MAG TPA: glycosyl hydrolase 108 family protein [Chitinophagaceae bacterium]|nr:glycosyl hydrolase 108 family protein [Chitinophagaceae bacterium]